MLVFRVNHNNRVFALLLRVPVIINVNNIDQSHSSSHTIEMLMKLSQIRDSYLSQPCLFLMLHAMCNSLGFAVPTSHKTTPPHRLPLLNPILRAPLQIALPNSTFCPCLPWWLACVGLCFAAGFAVPRHSCPRKHYMIWRECSPKIQWQIRHYVWGRLTE